MSKMYNTMIQLNKMHNDVSSVYLKIVFFLFPEALGKETESWDGKVPH